MSVIRAFIAIELPEQIQHHLGQVTYQMVDCLKDLPGNAVRWVSATNIHLTLKFLGDVSVANLDLLKEMLQAEVAGHKPFEFSVGGLGAYPSAQRPRVIWVGVEAPVELGAVHSGVESRLEKLGYAREERPFSPHLTLGRVSRNLTNMEARQISEALRRTKVGFLGVAPVRDIRLFKSDLKPGGAVYTCLYTAQLGAGAG